MSLQFILGPSGSGKSYYIYKRVIEESIKNPKTNYILLVPEQYSMALQRKMVMLHPGMGTMNIDVIGFNRLAYRVFDELNIKPTNVLEDFGKTMLLRQVAGSIKDELKIYGGCLDKNGFIDETKSLMSELYQYDINRSKLEETMNIMLASGENLLTDKLNDMLAIFKAFDKKIESEYIVAEQLTELLADVLEKSELIKNSYIIMDGFTGFTPIQLKLIRGLLSYSKGVSTVVTIDKNSYDKEMIYEHELFYLSRQTIDNLKSLANEQNVKLEEDIFISSGDTGRWNLDSKDLRHLEENIFRFPYKQYNGISSNIKLSVYDNPRNEMISIAERIYRLVNEEGYRYKDIAVISGNLDGAENHVKQIFKRYDIPFFVDKTTPVKNNAYIDAIGHLLRIVDENFSYDSVFSFLKAGLLKDVSTEEIEELENYVLAKGVRGRTWWEKEWKCEADESRAYIMEVLSPFAVSLGKRKHKVSEFIEAIKLFMNTVDYKAGMSDVPKVYEGLCDIFDKLEAIMANDIMRVSEFREILEVGLKELSLGRIPSCLDMVLIGDITRTRLEDVKVLFVVSVNDGIIPKSGASAQIISDKEKETLEQLGVSLAPTDKINSFIEQFYLYINMTKPSDRLYLSYNNTSDSGEVMRPSYIISRIQKVFPMLEANYDAEYKNVSTRKGSIGVLIDGMRALIEGDNSHIEETLSLYKLYLESGDKQMLDIIHRAFNYNNIPDRLSEEVSKLLKLRLLNQSVSKLEKYANCAYSYFLKYILELKERSISVIDNRDVGNILHSIMERLYRHVHDNLGNDWASISDAERDKLVTEFAYQVFDEEYENEGRNSFLREVFARIGRRTALVMKNITERDSFVPEYFEYKFNHKIEIPGKSYTTTINGIVDRGDVYYSQEDNTLKLRIIDYKSGDYMFDVVKLYDGLQLQLSIYMHIMQELAKGYKLAALNNAPVVPEGMYYYQMQDPYIKVNSEAEAEKERENSLSLKGLDYSNPAQFDAAINYAIKKLTDIVGDILEGEIDKNPMKSGNNSSCDYCEFKAICRFDDKCGRNSFRYPSFASNKDGKEKAFAKIMEEVGGTENGMD